MRSEGTAIVSTEMSLQDYSMPVTKLRCGASIREEAKQMEAKFGGWVRQKEQNS